LRGPAITNATIQAEFKQAAEEWLASPPPLLKNRRFFDWKFHELARRSLKTDVDFALHVYDLCERARQKKVGAGLDDEARLLEGYGWTLQHKWREALARFESMGNQGVWLASDGPFDCGGGCPKSALALAAECRAQLGKPDPQPGFHRDLEE